MNKAAKSILMTGVVLSALIGMIGIASASNNHAGSTSFNNTIAFNAHRSHKHGIKSSGFNAKGYNEAGYNKFGYNVDGYDKDGYSVLGHYNSDHAKR